jgi:hypothetical protein
VVRSPVVRAVIAAVVLGACSDGPDPGGLTRADARPPPPTSTTLVVTITDGPGGPPIPGRIVLHGEDGKHLSIGKLDMWDIEQDLAFCDLGPGVVGTWDSILLPDGTGEIPVGGDHCAPSPAVPFGRYRLVALQGIEHEMFETEVVLEPARGKIHVIAPLARAWRADGALSADLHVHAEGSGDSIMPRDLRVQTELVAGVQVIGSSDHNRNDGFIDQIIALGLEGKIASLPGNEASTDMAHANVFPAAVDPGAPRNGAPAGEELLPLTARELWTRLRQVPGARLIQLNHPRLRWAAYYDWAGWDGESWPPPMPVDFDAVEVLNGMSAFDVPGDERIQRSAGDLYTLVHHGVYVTGVANSDTHHLSNFLAGVPRNYVYADDLRLEPFDEDGFVDALKRRRVLMTTGPLLEVDAAGAGAGGLAVAASGKVPLTIRLRQASYAKTSRVRVLVGRELRHAIDVPPGATAFEWSGELAVGPDDTWIGVDAGGTEPLPRELHGLGAGKHPMPPFAMINPILVDVDGDGFRPAQKPWIAPDLAPPPWDGKSPPAECFPARDL